MKVYGDSSSFWTIKKWAAEFKCAPTSLKYDPQESSSKSTTEFIEPIYDMVLNDNLVKVHEITEAVGISSAWWITNEKLCAKWCHTSWHQTKHVLIWKSLNNVGAFQQE